MFLKHPTKPRCSAFNLRDHAKKKSDKSETPFDPILPPRRIVFSQNDPQQSIFWLQLFWCETFYYANNWLWAFKVDCGMKTKWGTRTTMFWAILTLFWPLGESFLGKMTHKSSFWALSVFRKMFYYANNWLLAFKVHSVMKTKWVMKKTVFQAILTLFCSDRPNIYPTEHPNTSCQTVPNPEQFGQNLFGRTVR